MSFGTEISTQPKPLSIPLETLESLLSRLSHELKNPLSIVRGNAQLCMMISKDEKMGTCLKRVVDAVDAMTDKLNEIHCLRKAADSSKQIIIVAEVVRSAMSLLTGKINMAGIDLHIKLATTATVFGSREMLLCAIKHLIQNAIDAMPNGGTLTVELESHGGKVYFAVSDMGGGIPVELQSMIFRDFFTTKAGACGWGLVLVDQVVRVSHGGAVQFITSNKGTTFTVSLPLYEETKLPCCEAV